MQSRPAAAGQQVEAVVQAGGDLFRVNTLARAASSEPAGCVELLADTGNRGRVLLVQQNVGWMALARSTKKTDGLDFVQRFSGGRRCGSGLPWTARKARFPGDVQRPRLLARMRSPGHACSSHSANWRMSRPDARSCPAPAGRSVAASSRPARRSTPGTVGAQSQSLGNRLRNQRRIAHKGQLRQPDAVWKESCTSSATFSAVESCRSRPVRSRSPTDGRSTTI